MSSKRNQHVVPRSTGWAVKGAGAQRATALFEKKADAVQRGRDIAKKQATELVVHSENGRIQFKDSHGGDPYPPKG